MGNREEHAIPPRSPSGKNRPARSMRAMTDVHRPPPREPEIELLGRIARRALWVLRRVLWIGGAVAIGYGIRMMVVADDAPAPAPDAGELPKGPALGFVWICAGLPALVRA